MKKSTKKSILIGAAAALAASLVPYECKVEENGDFSFTSLLLGVYRRRRADGEKSAVTVTVANAPCFTAEAKARRDRRGRPHGRRGARRTDLRRAAGRAGDAGAARRAGSTDRRIKQNAASRKSLKRRFIGVRICMILPCAAK